MKLPLFKIRNLTKIYPNGNSLFAQSAGKPAVSNISFDIYRGEVLGVVGESGSGKTTLGKCLNRLIEPSAGKIFYDGEDLLALPEKTFRRLRARFQMIFQNPLQAFNPRMSVYQILSEAARQRPSYRKGTEQEIINHYLQQVGLTPDLLDRHPGEISGGQGQRVAIARALIMQPHLLIADEPTSSLDNAIKYQLIEELMRLKQTFELTILLITHDLAVVRRIADRIAIMYGGKIVEIGTPSDIFNSPGHPYTRLLLSAANFVTEDIGATRDDSPFSPALSISHPIHGNGCAFADRCPLARSDCFHTEPTLEAVKGEHLSACLRQESLWIDPAQPPSPTGKKQLKGEALK